MFYSDFAVVVFVGCHRGRVKAAEKPHETTEEAEFRKQQEMQKELKQMTRRVRGTASV